jgi:DNA-binding phage protein
MIENRIMNESYKFYNHENINNHLSDYMQPQVLEFEDMHYIEKSRQENERSKNMQLLT